MVLDWKVYEVENIIYKKKIANNYYEYIANIKISNANAELPTIINKELSTDKYVVISLYFNIIKEHAREREYQSFCPSCSNSKFLTPKKLHLF